MQSRPYKVYGEYMEPSKFSLWMLPLHDKLTAASSSLWKNKWLLFAMVGTVYMFTRIPWLTQYHLEHHNWISLFVGLPCWGMVACSNALSFKRRYFK